MSQDRDSRVSFADWINLLDPEAQVDRSVAQQGMTEGTSSVTVEDMQMALQYEDFELHYHPIIDISTQKPVALEALIRWRREDGTLVPPISFLPLAEKTGLITRIGYWVVFKAAHDLREVEMVWSTPLVSYINLSLRQIQDEQFVQSALAAVEPVLGTDVRKLGFEFDHSLLVDYPELIKTRMQELRGNGFKISIDDFGSRLSLEGIAGGQADLVKLDRLFTAAAVKDRDCFFALKAMQRYASSEGLTLVPKGIETDNEKNILQELNFNAGQGFLFGQPMPLNYLKAWLKNLS